VHRLSYSALALYRRCGYRYFAQRVLGLPEPEIPREEGAGLDPLQLGDAVHLELERADGRWRTLYPHATAEDGERVEGFLANWQVSEIAGELATLAEVRREVPFSFEVDGVLFRGRLDVMARPDPESALIVDYKTNRLSEKSVEEVVDASYGVQVTTYAVAALRGGAHRVRIVYAFLERPQAIVVREFSEPDRGRLEGELSDAIAQIRGGRFPARPGPHCVDCPALDLLCAGPRLEWDA
jgi:RecB family exonuclease